MIKQGLSQKLLQKLSPQQIQLMKLLQIPTAQLEQRIKEEMEINPALEEGGGDDEELYAQSDLSESLQSEEDSSEDGEMMGDSEPAEEVNTMEEIDIDEYYEEDDTSDYKTSDPGEVYDPEDDNKSIPIVNSSSLHENLEEQIALTGLSEREKDIAIHLIGSLDDDGYLRRELSAIADDLAFSSGMECSEQELEKVLNEIHLLDPPGIGARSLEECLLIQLRRKEHQTEFTQLAIRMVKKHFDHFANKRYEKLASSLGIDQEKLKLVMEEVVHLNPKPASAYSDHSEAEQYVIPDFILSNNNNELVLSLNSKNAPELRVSESFREMLDTYKKARIKSKEQKEAVLFIKQKIDAAKWFIDAIRQRQNTLLLTMHSIMERQKEFLLTGDETAIRPMILKDVADDTGLDISTVSRVANSKFIQTEFGTLSLKSFFSESMQTDSGEEVSTREVKKILEDIISAEDKSDPVSDIRLAEILAEKGYNIARRTVAKYREQLNLPVARLRKEI
jgi:RNA polymerase sigma-54 factor